MPWCFFFCEFFAFPFKDAGERILIGIEKKLQILLLLAFYFYLRLSIKCLHGVAVVCRETVVRM